MAGEDFLRALGEVTTEASAVEYAVGYLVILARGQDGTDLAKILTRVGGARSELDRLTKEMVGVSTGHESLCQELVGLYKRMSFALWERNRLVHAVEVLRLSERLGEVELTLWHPKTDAALHVDSGDLSRLADELRGIAGTALRLTHRVCEWRADQDIMRSSASNEADDLME